MGVTGITGYIIMGEIQSIAEACTGTSCTLTGPMFEQPVLFALTVLAALLISAAIVYVRDGWLGGDGGDRDGD